MDAFGRIDIVVNNATAGGNDNLWTFSEEEWDRTQDVNLKGYFALIRAAVPHLAESGSGAIVNTSSSSGFGHPSHVAYASAKEGVVGLTRTVAKEVGRFGIRCNAIRPLALGPGVSELEYTWTLKGTKLAETSDSLGFPTDACWKGQQVACEVKANVPSTMNPRWATDE